MDDNLSILDEPSYQNLYRFVINYADGVIVTSPDADTEIIEYAKQCGKKVLDYVEGDETVVYDNYKRFYDEL